MRLVNRCAIVTGAGSGLGRATAEMLYENGAHVVLAEVCAERSKELAAKLGNRAVPLEVDVRSATQVDAALDLAKDRFGAVHIVVNCAGIASAATTLSKSEPHSLELWREVIEVNLTGTFNVLRLAAAHMIRNPADEETGERGVIINTASISAFEGQRGQAAYAASKAGVVGLTLPVARDLAQHAIRCVAIAPGLFDTAMLDGIPEKGVQALTRALLFPSRAGYPAEFAGLVRHVVENPYLNAVCLRLDGGARLHA
jgi:NAD(P)-dependent dehydrogenase (short-subunit alcohol dehydrogenase family)